MNRHILLRPLPSLSCSKEALFIVVTLALIILILALKVDQELEFSSHRLGIALAQDEQGVFILELNPQGPAASTGLKSQDYIDAIDNHPITSLDELDRQLAQAGTSMELQVHNRAGIKKYRLTPGMAPDFSDILDDVMISGFYLILAIIAVPRKAVPLSFANQLLIIILVTMALNQLLIQLQLPIFETSDVKTGLIYFLTFLSAFMSASLLGMEVHLLTLAPRPSEWLKRHSKLISGIAYGVSGYLLIIISLEYFNLQPSGWLAILSSRTHWSIINILWAIILPLILLLQFRATPAAHSRRLILILMTAVMLWSMDVIVQEIYDLAAIEAPAWFPLTVYLSNFILAIALLVSIKRFSADKLNTDVHNLLIYRIISGLFIIITLNEILNSGYFSLPLSHSQLLLFAFICLLAGVLWDKFALALRYFISRPSSSSHAESDKIIDKIFMGAMAYNDNALIIKNMARLINTRLNMDWVCIFVPRQNQPPYFFYHSNQHLAVDWKSIENALAGIAHQPASAEDYNALHDAGASRVLPLSYRQNDLGFMVLKQTDNEPAVSAYLLSHLTEQLAELIYNNRLRYQATHDGLTKLLRRETIIEKLYLELQRQRRTRNEMTIAMVDFDHFKDINDRFGHQAGDIVLKKISGLLADRLRGQDYIGRYGGEEFLLVFPNTTAQKAFKLLETLRLKVASSKLSIENNPAIHITISIGISSSEYFTADNFSANLSDAVNRLIAQADSALYQAKQQGRNCVIEFTRPTTL